MAREMHKKECKTCKNCGKSFKVFYSEIKKGVGLFCNRKCYYQYVKLHPIRGCLGKHWKHTAEYKKRLSLSRMGKNNPNYISGSTKTRRAKTQRIKNWRLKVFNRDDFTCQECNKKGGDINAHHIIFWSEDKDKRFLIGNGVTLCVPCHKYVHSFYKNIRHYEKENSKIA